MSPYASEVSELASLVMSGSAPLAGARRATSRVGGLVSAMVGLVFFGIGLSLRPSIPADWVRAPATVVELRDQGGTSRGGHTYAPVVEYRVGGVAYRVAGRVGIGGLGEPRIGDPSSVAYDPTDPGHAELTDAASALIWIPIAGVGLLVLLMGASQLRRA